MVTGIKKHTQAKRQYADAADFRTPIRLSREQGLCGRVCIASHITDYKSVKPKARLILLLVALSFIIVSGCEQNRFQKAELLFNQKRYASAIEYMDNYIKTGNNGAMVTRAELIRSESYYELGMIAIEKENWVLAIRLLKLANSETSDVKLAEVYKTLAIQAMENQDVQTTLGFLTLIINEIPTSVLSPEVLQLRIKVVLDNLGDKVTAWNDYRTLYDKYPDNPYEILARPYVLRFIDINVNDAITKAAAGQYDTALGELFQISRYPIANLDKINLNISNIYQAQAEIQVQEQNYLEADRYFRQAIEYYPTKEAEVMQRLREIASLYIDKGNSYLQIRDFENALVYFRKTFEIIPDFDLALQAIKRVATIQENIARAAILSSDAQKAESAKNYTEALRLYNQAYQLDKEDAYYQNSLTMTNLIEANKNPMGFARRIINEYRGGILSKRIAVQKQELLKTYKADEIRDSGWKMLLSSGQYKYEARYDLITAKDNYYFVWQVNLKERTVVPLNKMSEKLMQ